MKTLFRFLWLFRRTWKLVQSGTIVYHTVFPNRSQVRIPGMFEGNLIVEAGTELVVYVVTENNI